MSLHAYLSHYTNSNKCTCVSCCYESAYRHCALTRRRASAHALSISMKLGFTVEHAQLALTYGIWAVRRGAAAGRPWMPCK